MVSKLTARRKGSGGGTAVEDPTEVSSASGAAADPNFFTRKVIKDLKELGASGEEVKKVVGELAKLYANDKGAAEAKFEKIHNAFMAARDADNILAEEETKAEGLLKLADNVEGLNVAKARLLARMGMKIPGVRVLASALETLANLELDVKGLEISEKGVFETLAGFIRGTDSKLKERGIEVNGEALDKIRVRAAEVLEHESVQGLVSGVTGIADKFGIDLGNLAKAVASKATGVGRDDLTELGEMATSPTGPKGKGPTRKR